ncbi:MAG: helix-turn-helix domain-containing protein [Candidatus Methanomethylicaceae archaeon]
MDALKPAEVAKRLGISKDTVFRFIKQGKLRRIKVSERIVYIEPESLKECFGESIIRLRFPELYETEK